MRGARQGTLEVHRSSDGGLTYPNILLSVSGDQGNQWVFSALPVTPDANNEVHVRFYGIRGTSFTSDMAIDDVQFGEPRPGDFSGKVVSSERALKELGWAPEVPFEEGLRRYIDWYREVRTRKEAEWAAVDGGLAGDGVTQGVFSRTAPK